MMKEGRHYLKPTRSIRIFEGGPWLFKIICNAGYGLASQVQLNLDSTAMPLLSRDEAIVRCGIPLQLAQGFDIDAIVAITADML